MELRIPSRSVRSCADMFGGSPARITSRVPSTSRIHNLFCCLGACAKRLGAAPHRNYIVLPKYSEPAAYAFVLVVVGDRLLDLLPFKPVDGDIARGCSEPRQLRIRRDEVVDGRTGRGVDQHPFAPLGVDVADIHEHQPEDRVGVGLGDERADLIPSRPAW